MKISQDKVVAVSYCLRVEGKIADSAGSEKPLEYIHGTGMLLPKFEKELEGKQEGDDFAFTLTPSEGYGEYNPAFRFEVPKSTFEVDGQLREDLLRVGNLIPMMNSDGQVLQGTIYAIGEDSVTMDFNHPMAGKTLNFSGKVESVREATPKELTEGLHGEYLPKEECGGCHGGGCCHSEGHECHHDEEGHECHHGQGCCHSEGHKCHKEE